MLKKKKKNLSSRCGDKVWKEKTMEWLNLGEHFSSTSLSMLAVAGGGAVG